MSAVMSIHQALSSGVDELTYRSYAAQRQNAYPPEKLAKHFPNTEAMEERYQREQAARDAKQDALAERFAKWAKDEELDTESSNGFTFDDDKTEYAWRAVKAFCL